MTRKKEKVIGVGKKARLIAEDMGCYLQEWVYVRVEGRILAVAEEDVENYSSKVQACANVAGQTQMALKREMARIQWAGVEA